MRILKKIVKWFFISIGLLLIVLMILPYFFEIQQRELPQNYKPYSNSEFLTKYNTRIHYQKWMPKTDTIKKHIVYIHGFSGSSFSFRKNIYTLVQQGNEVVAIDMPAFGYSDKSEDANYNDTIRLELIKTVLEKCSPQKKWILIGHSLGASIIAQFACKYGQNVQSLVFIDGPAFDNSDEKPGILNKLVLFPPLKRWAEVIAYNKVINENRFKELLSSAYAREPDKMAVSGYMAPFLYKNSAGAIFNMSAGSGYAQIKKEKLNKFRCLLIWGEKDEWIPISTGDTFAKEINGIKYQVISGAGHCSMETHPEEVNKTIAEFINY